jgi:hypothetical protein
MSEIDKLHFQEALAGIAAGIFSMLYAIYYLQRSMRRMRTHASAANLTRLFLALAGFWFGLAFISNSLALAWLLGWTGPYELIPQPYATLLDVGTRAGEIGTLLFGGIGAVLGISAWRLHVAGNRHTMRR